MFTFDLIMYPILILILSSIPIFWQVQFIIFIKSYRIYLSD